MSTPLTLRGLTARPVLVPLRRPIVARIATIETWPVVLIDLETDEGVVGRGYVEPYTLQATRAVVAAIEDLGERLRGEPVAPVPLFDTARRSLHFVGYAGISAIAVSGVDMAAWDAAAKAVDRPLCVLLGGTVGAVRAYNSNGLWLQPPEALGAEAAALQADGDFGAVKMRLGRARARDDMAAVEAVRAAVGEDVEVMADYNQALDLSEALRRGRQVDDLGLSWIEEPLVYDDLAGYRRVTADLRTPIQIGENFYGPRDVARAIEGEACDLVMPDFMRIGGVTGWLRAAALAAASGVPVSTHLYPEVGAHVMRVTETAHWLEWVDWTDPVLAEPFPVADGHVQVPDRAGVGIAWDEEWVKAHLVS